MVNRLEPFAPAVWLIIAVPPKKDEQTVRRIALILRPESKVPPDLHAFRDRVLLAVWLGAVVVLGIAVR